MQTFAKIAIAIGLGTFALTAFGNATPTPDDGLAAFRPVTSHEAMSLRAARWSKGCTGAEVYAGPLAGPVGDLDMAAAALIVHGEFYYGRTSTEIREAIALLPRWSPNDGISQTEAAALETLLKLGRQLAYAEAAEEIEHRLGTGTSVLVADAAKGITPEILRSIEPTC